MASKSSLADAFEKVKGLFGIEKLKEEQLDILTSVIRGEDYVVVLPTGFGKSLPYQVTKTVSNELNHEFQSHRMFAPHFFNEDQVSRLQTHGNLLKAMYKGQEDCSAAENYDIIFSSPEHLVVNAD
ncbi:probable ATP-dependent DNA helicase RecS [Ostrea edulis]|uniref:probable ATP-dependent DNA helicase RecS n=1 Tax=Ostrea edulis TaxID=37623 RepID=UPI00209448E2|nr:probable ATP-dependent DNA helicase RecS [Ostrea edulis]